MDDPPVWVWEEWLWGEQEEKEEEEEEGTLETVNKGGGL